MSDYENVVHAVRIAMGENREIDDATARVIASLYHSGQWSDSYSFASTGAIADASDIWHCCFPDYAGLENEREKLIADMLGTYLLNRADKSAVPGWSKLWLEI